MTEQLNEPQYPISSVDNALRLLLMFRDQSEVRLSEAAAALGVANSTAHRLLAMLTYHGFVRQDPSTKGYRPGAALFDVGLAVVGRLSVRAAAHPVLEELSAELGETVHCAVLEGASARYIDGVESGRALRVGGRTGMVLPAHVSAAGKALLAELTDEQLVRLYRDQPLTSGRGGSAAAIEELLHVLAQVRKCGYALNVEESEEGVTAVGVVVRDPSGTAIAALSCAAPSARLGKARAKPISDVLARGAQRVTARLGAVGLDH